MTKKTKDFNDNGTDSVQQTADHNKGTHQTGSDQGGSSWESLNPENSGSDSEREYLGLCMALVCHFTGSAAGIF
ncbi:MAG: hypothetical protein DRI57_03805 [Deltaproteobacteria bacterium]|nr:MAG: hypothetical protein DRI57_03805 [Deltaproteobacteria bacterium]